MSHLLGTYQRDVEAQYQLALDLQESSKSLAERHLKLVTEVKRLVSAIEQISGSSPGDGLSRSLHHWGRELVNGNMTAASIHLSRVGVQLGLRGSDARPWTAAPPARETKAPTAEAAVAPARPSPAPVAKAPAPVAKAPAPVAKVPAPVAKAPAPASSEAEDEYLAPLSPEERALVLQLPFASEPLEGAGALAACWGDVMNPTSARGRYSRLANKLKDHHGRDVLLRGRGRYARLEDWE